MFGPASKLRTKLRALVPSEPTQQARARCAAPPPASTASRARRLPWADRLQRVFADDVLQCPCGGRRSIVAIARTHPNVFAGRHAVTGRDVGDR